jgi:hypothetical protein
MLLDRQKYLEMIRSMLNPPREDLTGGQLEFLRAMQTRLLESDDPFITCMQYQMIEDWAGPYQQVK